MGLEDDRRDGYWIYLKVCDVGEDCDHRVQKNERGDIGFFFRVGVDGYMLADTEENRNLCTLYNLTLLGSMIPDFLLPYIGDEIPETKPPKFDQGFDIDATGEGYFDDWNLIEDSDSDDIFDGPAWGEATAETYNFEHVREPFVPKYEVGQKWNYNGVDAKMEITKQQKHKRGTYSYLLHTRGELTAPETLKATEANLDWWLEPVYAVLTDYTTWPERPEETEAQDDDPVEVVPKYPVGQKWNTRDDARLVVASAPNTPKE